MGHITVFHIIDYIEIYFFCCHIRVFFISNNFFGFFLYLFIYNCIIMGRAEAYAQANPPIPALLDGIAAGIGYTWVLLGISLIRELMGFGSIFGIQVLGDWWTKWTIMVMPPSAFFILAVFIWVFNSKKGVSK